MTHINEQIERIVGEFKENFSVDHGPTAGDTIYPYPMPMFQAWLQTALTSLARSQLEGIEAGVEKLERWPTLDKEDLTEVWFDKGYNEAIRATRSLLSEQKALLDKKTV